jgi:putative ABC transport system permease protein
VAGDPGALRDGTAVVSKPAADAEGWRVGTSATVRGKRFDVVAVLPGRAEGGRDAAADRRILLTERDFVAHFPGTPVTTVEVDAAPGVSAERAAVALQDLSARYPAVTVMDLTAYKKVRTAGVNQLLTSVLALLALAVVIALVGVANTLTLSVVERIREYGVLRALGMTARQLRIMLSTEAMLVSAVGAVLGVSLGVAVAAAAIGLVRQEGPISLIVPGLWIAALIAVAAAAALVASVLPARRAVRSPIVAALATE